MQQQAMRLKWSVLKTRTEFGINRIDNTMKLSSLHVRLQLKDVRHYGLLI